MSHIDVLLERKVVLCSDIEAAFIFRHIKFSLCWQSQAVPQDRVVLEEKDSHAFLCSMVPCRLLP